MFRVGQKVVAIRNHSTGMFKKGQVFYIKEIKTTCCDQSLITIGIHAIGGSYCVFCNTTTPKGIHGSWFSIVSFRPLSDDFADEIEARISKEVELA